MRINPSIHRTDCCAKKNMKADNEFMPWTKMTVDNAQLTFWPGITVKESDLTGDKGLLQFFKKAFDIVPTPVGCVETLPDKNIDGDYVEGTGGRVDFFFFVNNSDIDKFAFKRFRYHMRWWEDVYFNHGESIYPSEFRRAYPNPNTD